VSARPRAAAVTGKGVVDPTLPLVAADDEGFARGRAAFETLRVYGGRPFRLEQHLARLAASATMLGLPDADPAALRKAAAAALAEAGLEDAVLRLYWTPGPDDTPFGIALVSDIPPWIEVAREGGQRLVSLVYPRRSYPWLLPGTKSVSYATHIAADAEAKRRGADDAVFVDPDGTVLEGPVTNIWWREGEILATPSLELGILAGETRAALLGLAEDVGYAVEIGDYPLSRLYSADEVFTSSSVREVMPVVEVDGVKLESREAAVALQQALRQLATT
jgi:4-amino-4-deoxychorismate lyase